MSHGIAPGTGAAERRTRRTVDRGGPAWCARQPPRGVAGTNQTAGWPRISAANTIGRLGCAVEGTAD